MISSNYLLSKGRFKISKESSIKGQQSIYLFFPTHQMSNLFVNKSENIGQTVGRTSQGTAIVQKRLKFPEAINLNN